MKLGRSHCGRKVVRLFENRVLGMIFGPRRDEVTGKWRRLHNEELYALYSSPNIIRVIKSRRLRWAGHVARMGEMWVVYRALVGKPEVRRPPGRPKSRWEDNIKIDLREIDWGGIGFYVTQDRDRVLWIRWWTFGFRKMRGIWVA